MPRRTEYRYYSDSFKATAAGFDVMCADSSEIIEPKMWPEDLLDGLCAALGLLIIVHILFFIPAVIVTIATNSSFLGVIAFFGFWGAFSMFTVEKLEITNEGITFVRKYGSPKFLAWSDIVSIREVSRPEIIWKGWLWPLFPPREMAPCFSSLGHFKIEWSGGTTYFPPNDPDSFRNLADKYKKNVHT